MDESPTPIAEIEHGPSKFEIFLEENQKLLITLAILIFVGVLGYVGYISYGEYTKAQAGEALSEANDEAELQAVISQHGNTASAGSAALLLADQKAQESPEAAIGALRDFVNTYTDHPALPTATTSLGLQLLNDGKLDEAKAQLGTVLDMENADYIIPAAKIALADIAKQQGDLASARQYYTEVSNLTLDADIANLNKYSQYVQIANQRLRFIETSAPTAVEKKTPVEVPAAPQVKPAEATPAPASEENQPVEENNENNSQVAE